MIEQSAELSKPKITKIILHFALILVAAFITIPLYYVFVSTFKTPQEALLSPMGIPLHPILDNYIKAVDVMKYPNALKNNVIITSFSVLFIIIITSMAAYPLARLRNKFNTVVFFVILAGLMVPYQMLLFPLFKLVSGLGLVNKLSGIIVIMTSINIPFAVFLFTGFIKTLPYELEEAAHIDGCGVFGIYWKIILPLLKPVIATVAIIDALATWNDFLTPLLFIQSRENSVLLLEVFRNVGQFSSNYFLMLPMLILTIAPMLTLYVFLQKYIIKGVISGSLKG